jgi:hypothetical protein
MLLTGKLPYVLRHKSITMSVCLQYLTRTSLGSNPRLCCERPATNRLSHGMAESIRKPPQTQIRRTAHLGGLCIFTECKHFLYERFPTSLYITRLLMTACLV